MRRVLAVTGPPCGGKSHFVHDAARHVSEAGLRVCSVSTGHVARSLADDSQRLLLDAGCMMPVPDEPFLRAVFSAADTSAEVLIIDGAPRYERQVDALIDLAREHHADLAMLILMVPVTTVQQYAVRRFGLADGHRAALDARLHLWYGRQFHEVYARMLQLGVQTFTDTDTALAWTDIRRK